MTNLTVLQLFFIVIATVFCTVPLSLLAKAKITARPCKPVMETGRDKGKMVIGTYDVTH